MQLNAINGSIEPIYENVPLPPYATPSRNSEMRGSNSSSHERKLASANNSQQIVAPIPAARHHKKQQQQQLSPPPAIVSDEPDEISMNIKKFSNHTDRAASTELQFLEPNPSNRVMRAASAAPAIGSTSNSTQQISPSRHNSRNSKTTNNSTSSGYLSTADLSHSSSSVFIKSSPSRNDESATSNVSMLHQQFSAMNLSSNSSASAYNTSLDTTAGTTSTSSSSKEGKRKKRWNILGRSKTPDKQKSATLGREKTNAAANKGNKMKMVAQDDLILPNRWSTGAPKLQPISGQLTKDKLVSNFFFLYLTKY